MSEELDAPVTEVADEGAGPDAPESDAPKERAPAPPVESRFMFVDIAALRAKQLRRGARPRVGGDGSDEEDDPVVPPRKLERIAMAEVERGLIHYSMPAESSGDDPGAPEGAAS